MRVLKMVVDVRWTRRADAQPLALSIIRCPGRAEKGMGNWSDGKLEPDT